MNVIGLDRLLMRRRAAVVALVALLTLVGGACSDTTTRADRTAPTAENALRVGGTVTYAADVEPRNFNLRSANGNDAGVNNVMRRVWPAVWRTTPTFEWVLDTDVVTSAEMTPASGDIPQTIVYRINPAAKWSDDRPITADDFVYAWQVQQPDTKDVDGKPIQRLSAPGEDTIRSVGGSPDGRTVTVTLKQPFVEWKSLFSRPLLPSHIARDVGFNTGFQEFRGRNISDVVLSAGPFRIQDFQPGQHLTLVRNEKYWGKPAVLDSIVFRFVGESSDAVTALSNRDVDVISPRVQTELRDRLAALADVHTTMYAGLDAEFLDFNTRHDFLGIREVRQAFALALDRRAIVDRTVGLADPNAKVMNNRVFGNSMPEYVDNAGRFGRQSISEAKRLLEGAGFSLDADRGVYVKDGRPLEVTLGLTSGDDLRKSQAEFVQAQVKQAGIAVQIRTADTANAVASGLREGRFDIVNLSQGMSLQPSTTDRLFGTAGTINIARYSNPKVDELYGQAKSEFDDKKRTEILNSIDRLLWEDMPRIPLYQRPSVVAHRKTLANVTPNASSSIFWNAEQWGIKAGS